MGVIEKLGSRAPVIHVSAESINSLGISQPPTPPSEPESIRGESPIFVPRLRNPGQLFQRLENHRQNQHTGVRKLRRTNNIRALQTLMEDELEETSELSITDLQPKTQNAFTRLLNSNDNMRVWQYFITRNETEQRKYLEAISPKRQNGNVRPVGGISFTQVAVNPDEGEWNLINIKGLKSVPAMSDCRRVHPAYNEELRFSMMEPQLQSVLKRKHLPLGVLSNLEQEIMETFVTDPSAVFINQDLTSFERLLLHALCQYNFLSSKSKNIAGVRTVTVENIEKCFHAPEMSLTQYIETYYRAK